MSDRIIPNTYATSRPRWPRGGRSLVPLCMLLLAGFAHCSKAEVPACTSAMCWVAPEVAPNVASVPKRTIAPLLGSSPELHFEQANIDFGVVDTGESGLLMTAELVNYSTSTPATLLHFTSDPSFPLMLQFGSCQELDSLQPGASCSVRIQFAPTAPGAASGTLTAVSAESAEATLSLGGVGGADYVLYAQSHDWGTPSFLGMVDTAYSNSPEHTSDMAEDFLVEDEQWTIQKVGIEAIAIASSSIPPMDFDFLADVDGVPGTDPLCPESIPSVIYWEPPYDENRTEVALTPPCTLPSGHYWLQVSFRAEDYSQPPRYIWGLQYVVRPEEPPAVHLRAPVWRQPAGGGSCSDWTPLYPANCGLEDYDGFAAYGAVFWLVGHVSGDSIFEDGFDSH